MQGSGLETNLLSRKTNEHQAAKPEFQNSRVALNPVLTCSGERARKMVQTAHKIIQKGAFCVGIGSFYCKKRILVPMSYIDIYNLDPGL